MVLQYFTITETNAVDDQSVVLAMVGESHIQDLGCIVRAAHFGHFHVDCINPPANGEDLHNMVIRLPSTGIVSADDVDVQEH